MLLAGGLVLWALLLYAVVSVLSAALVVGTAWCCSRMVGALVRGPRPVSERRLHPDQVLTSRQALRNYDLYVRYRATGGLRRRRGDRGGR